MRRPLPRPGDDAADDMASAKHALRRTMRRVRDGIAPAEAEAAARVAAQFLVELVIARGAGLVALYAAVKGELATNPAARLLLDRGVALAYPRVLPSQRRLGFHRVGDLGDLAPATFGIPEPDPSAPLVPVGHIDLFVVPGLAFDRHGRRLGWGRGHYDETLAHSDAARVGYAFDRQIVDAVPAGYQDLPMDYLITESGTSPVEEPPPR